MRRIGDRFGERRRRGDCRVGERFGERRFGDRRVGERRFGDRRRDVRGLREDRERAILVSLPLMEKKQGLITVTRP